MKITHATHDDLPGILKIQRDAYQAEARIYNDDSLPPLRDSLADLEAALARGIVLKAELDGRLAGSVRAVFNDGVCEIGRLSVAPEFQKQGIGSALLRACESLFAPAHCCELFTGAKSLANLRLYEKLGYRRTGERVQSPKVNLIYLRKEKS